MKIPMYFDNPNYEQNKILKHNGFNVSDNKKLFFDNDNPYQFIKTILENNYQIVGKKYKGKYFYPIYFSCFFSKITQVLIPHKVLKDLKKNRVKILIANAAEGNDLNEFESKIVDYILTPYNIKKEQVILITGNLKKQTNLGIKNLYFNTWESIINFYTDKQDWNELFDKNVQGIFNGHTLKNKFICLQRRPKVQRFALFSELYEFKDSGILTLGTGDQGDCKKTIVSDTENNLSFNYPKSYLKYKQKKIRKKLPAEYDANLSVENPVHDDNIEKYTSSYVHIVSETYFENSKQRMFFSEKIFKPMVFLRPFVLFGQQHSLKNLRDLGFKTFSNYIDEGYDDIENDQERFYTALESSKKLITMSDNDLQNLLKETFPILLHNYHHLYNIANSSSNVAKLLILNELHK
jgi:hypothetical protein